MVAIRRKPVGFCKKRAGARENSQKPTLHWAVSLSLILIILERYHFILTETNGFVAHE